MSKDKRQMEIGMAARWAVFELLLYLNFPSLDVEEVDVTGRMTPPPERSDVHTLSYFAPPVGVWIHITRDSGQYLPISAMIREEGNTFRYFSFVYDQQMDFRQIQELPERNGRFWMLIVGGTT